MEVYESVHVRIVYMFRDIANKKKKKPTSKTFLLTIFHYDFAAPTIMCIENDVI